MILLIILGIVFQALFEVAELRLRGANILVDLALQLLIGFANDSAADLLNFPRRFLSSTFNLVLVDAHDLLLAHCRHAADAQNPSIRDHYGIHGKSGL